MIRNLFLPLLFICLLHSCIFSMDLRACPCNCFGPVRMQNAIDQCESGRFLSICELSPCGRKGTQCCDPRTPSPSPSPFRPCPCNCFGPLRAQNPIEQCTSGRFVPSCTLSSCGKAGMQCCDPPVTAPSPSASPVIKVNCPCKCRTGLRKFDVAASECAMEGMESVCEVSSNCVRGNAIGAQCCDVEESEPVPSPSLSPVSCPCNCLTGINAMRVSTNLCARESTPDGCEVKPCFRGGASGYFCC